jgi:hypothetical protein
MPSARRIVERALLGEAENARGEQADDARDVIAVAFEALPVEVARLREIHLHPGDDFLQVLLLQGETLQMRREGARHRMMRLAGVHRADLLPPPRELGRGELSIGGLVDDVVDLPAEGVERGDRPAPLGRQEEKGIVEARAARGGLLLAVLVGRHTALRKSSGQSKALSLGRRRKTS